MEKSLEVRYEVNENGLKCEQMISPIVTIAMNKQSQQQIHSDKLNTRKRVHSDNDNDNENDDHDERTVRFSMQSSPSMMQAQFANRIENMCIFYQCCKLNFLHRVQRTLIDYIV